MILGFSGRKRSGKTCLAKMLQEEEGAIIITIADYLKQLCCELMNMSYEELNIKKDNGYTFDIVATDRWFNIINKHTNIDIDNIKSVLENKHISNIRELLQIIGTDVIRKYDEGWHVKQLVKTIESYSEDKLLVVDDVRFPNEKEAICKHGGCVFFLVRPNMLMVSNHISETSLKWQDFDEKHVIINDEDENKLKLHFLIHFKNNFNIYAPNSITLEENEEYLTCGNFGSKYNENNELLKKILRQLKDGTLFNEYGLIKFKTCSPQLAQKYVKEVDNSIHYVKSRCNEFVTNNPLITENLKQYI